MNLVLLDGEDSRVLAAGTPEAEHLLRVLKIAPGGTFWCGVKNGARALATVREISPAGAISFSVKWEETTAAPDGDVSAFLRVRLLVGLSRPQTMKKVLAVASELGCARIDVFRSEKGDPAYAESTLWKKGDGTIAEILKKSAQQTCSTAFPPVSLHRSLADFFATENDLRERHSGGDFSLVALDIYAAAKSLAETPIDFSTETLLLAVGPERGWSEREREILCGNAGVFAHLGERILRVETAVGAALSVALARGNAWRKHVPLAP